MALPSPADQLSWDVAYEAVLRELVRAGMDRRPLHAAALLLEAMRGGGWLPQPAALACFAWWYAHRDEQARQVIRSQVTTGMLTPAALASAVLCSGASVDCCPAFVAHDPAYLDQAELTARAQARRAAGGWEQQLSVKEPQRSSRAAAVASWLIAIGAFGSFGLALHRLVKEHLSQKAKT